MPSDPVSTVRAHVAALNSGDVERILDTLDPTAVFLTHGISVSGREELRRLFTVAEGDCVPETELRSAHVTDPLVVRAEMTRRLTVSDGSQRFSHAADVTAEFLINGGKIIRVTVL